MTLEKKMLGTWRSDRRRTLQVFAPYYLPRNKKRKRFISSMFGKLELRFTKKYIHSEFDEFKEKKRYEIIDSSDTSLVLRYQDTMMAELLEEDPATEYIIANFDETRYHEYLYLTHSSARFSECFRRVKKAKNAGAK